MHYLFGRFFYAYAPKKIYVRHTICPVCCVLFIENPYNVCL